ncbi:MAG: carbamoyltransferase C-terminal domain-containing protein [Candidatus Daviesbacteria bacterium]|nr:carbamoyltransferase C-terminal domain-containing protein [Candidatus Daviesbacteria bacterium]
MILKNSSVIVLGIHDGHNSGAALIRDGEVLAAINEERFNNIKNYSGAPVLAIKKVFEISKIKPSEVDLITIASFLRLDDPVKVEGNKLHLLAEYLAPLMHQKWFIKNSIAILHKFRRISEVKKVLDDLGIGNKKISFIEHHLAHAACAFYQRSWDGKTLILTLDGMGDGLSATVNIGSGFNIKRIAETSFYDSLGNNLYSEITAYLGMKRWEHEYKIMGLAPYGKPDKVLDVLRKGIRINPQQPLEFENISGYYLKKMQTFYQKALTGYRFDNIAAATQKLFEDLVVQWVKNAIKQTKLNKIVCAGGSFLNVKLNKLIRELNEVDEVFFYPAAEDGGSAVGAALEGYYRFCQQNKISAKKIQISDIYYGQSFSDEQITEFIKSKRLKNVARKVSPAKIAKLLTQGKIIARFSGRDEWGPRALGNRSIMADPRDMRVIRKINFAIKQRDFWMPFAPAVLEEDQGRYFKKSRFAPYMIEAFDTTDEAQEIIAGLHPYDLTGRPQTVNNWNPCWQAIIREFKKLTSVGGIVNTSFNLHGYPLVGNLEQALWTFRNSRLDGLLLGDWLIEK